VGIFELVDKAFKASMLRDHSLSLRFF
jgi:hypothetical protein